MKILIKKCCAIILLAIMAFSHPDNYRIGTDSYFGEPPPNDSTVLFAPGRVSTGMEEAAITFTPDGKECYWSVMFSGFETILTSRLENGQWTEPAIASFAGRYYDGWPAIQPDGKRLFFHSGRPCSDSLHGITAEFNIWFVDRTGNGWSEPKILPAPVNGIMNSTCPTLTKEGTLYFSKRYEDDTEKLVRSRYLDGHYQELEILPVAVNASKYNFHGTIAPDESFIIRPFYKNPGGWHYFVSFRDDTDHWSELIQIGEKDQSLLCGGSSSFSADGKYLFLQYRVSPQLTMDMKKKLTIMEMLQNENRTPAKGSADIYWMDTKKINMMIPAKKQ